MVFHRNVHKIQVGVLVFPLGFVVNLQLLIEVRVVFATQKMKLVSNASQQGLS